MKLVKFSNGKWGVRYGFFFHEYQDFQRENHTWRKGGRFFPCCMADEATAREWFELRGNGLTEEVVE